MSNKVLLFFVVACAVMTCSKTYATPPQLSSAATSHSKKTSSATSSTPQRQKRLTSGSSTRSEPRSLTKLPTLKVSTVTAEKIAARAEKAAKADARHKWNASAKKYNAGIRSRPDLEHLKPLSTKTPKAPTVHAEERPRDGFTAPTQASTNKIHLAPLKTHDDEPLTGRSDTSIDSTDDVDTPRAEIIKRFERTIQASATGYIPGGEENFKGRFSTATGLTPRTVDAHMEHFRNTASQVRAGIAAASAINTTGMSRAQLEKHVQTLKHEFGDNATQGIAKLRLIKKMSSPDGWYPGTAR